MARRFGGSCSGGGLRSAFEPRVGSHVDAGGRDLGEHLVGRVDALVGQRREVLEAVDPRRHGMPDAAQRVGVGEHPQAGVVRTVDEQAEVVEAELHAVDVAPVGRHPAAGHHLDHVDAALDALVDRGPDRRRAVDHAAEVVAVPLGPVSGGPARRSGGRPGSARSRKARVR